MTGEILKEFRRRLHAEGYEPFLDETGAGSVFDGNRDVLVMEDGEIQYTRENRPLAMNVKRIRDEVEEYMTEFEQAAPGIEKFPNSGKEDTRTLILFNGTELAARRLSDDSIDFVTWVHARGNRNQGHYFDDYSAAKTDYVVRAGLIDRDRLFNETELTVIRSNLSNMLTFDGGDNISAEKEQAIKNVIRKIDNVVVPEIHEQAEEAEEEGFEPEQEL